MKRALIYARVSSERQADEGQSVDSQIASCRAKAEALGAVVLHVFRDDGISGTTDARPGFRAAINRCALGDVDYLVCWSSSRFARDQHDAISYKRELVSYGTKLVYAQGQIDLESHEGWMLDSFQQVVDESYSRQVSADTKRSLIKAASEGFFTGGKVPFGYMAVPSDDGKRRRLAPNEAEAAVLQMIFDMALRGMGAYLIAVHLNQQGLQMRGRRWAKGTLLHMLKNEVYMGIIIYNRVDRKTRKERPEDAWIRVQAHTPVVSPDVFNQVQQGLFGRVPLGVKTAPNSNHVFTGMLRCGLCHSSLQVVSGTGRSGKAYQYFGCRGDSQGSKCSFKRMRTDAFEPWLVQQLLDKLVTRQTIQGVLDQLDEAASRWVKDRASRRTALVLELRTIEGRRNKLFDAIEEGGADTPGLKEMGPRLRKLNEQVERLEKALVSLENEQEPIVGSLDVSAEEAAEVFRKTVTECDDPKTVRALVASIAEKIVVNDGDVVVHYKPECLIQMDGNPVHSKHSWLPVPCLLRTTTLTIQRTGVSVKDGIVVARAA